MQSGISFVTLTTDFGLGDEYVGVMKGVILRFAPAARIIDLSHQIEPQNILQAASLLQAGYPYFPLNTLHVVVVDPGVGTNRRILWAKGEHHSFLAPDNGVLSKVIGDDSEAVIRSVTNRDLFLSPLSGTFHGRDIFAPVAGHLAAGLSPSLLGPEIAPGQIIRVDFPEPLLSEDQQGLSGAVTGSDRFGNLLTNIHINDLAGLDADPAKLCVSLGDNPIGPLQKSYGDKPKGTLLALIGSRGYLEIACSMANARQMLADHLLLPVIVTKSHSPGT
jgi:S-adenosylmethionine hydrolase